MYHYLIVGFGVAGFSFMQQLEENKRSFIVVDNNSQQSSRIAGGMFNPIILKRFTPAWKAAEMLPYALLQFKKAELKYNKKFIHYIDIYRKLASVEEQNNWMVAMDKPVMKDFMKPVIFKEIDGIDAPYGYGILQGTGIVNVASVLDEAIKELQNKKLILKEYFDYTQLQIHDGFVEYKGIKAKNIVFSEGYGLINNPFFNQLPLMGTKGEMLMIETEAAIPYIVKSAAFLAPDVTHNGRFYVGATYNWKDKTNEPTAEGKAQLEERLKKLLKKPYKVVMQKAGIRPTVKDRRPMVGKHPQYSSLSVLNGMGTRGVILAPSVSKSLFEYLEFGIPLPKEITIDRFQ
jgi:glycine/D-amino acid oxidase-like deaminating enzyme